MPGVTSYLKIAVSTRNWLAGSVCIGGGRMLWEVDVDRYDTDSLPLSSMGRFIARMGGGGRRPGRREAGRSVLLARTDPWPRSAKRFLATEGSEGGRGRLHLSCPHSFRVSIPHASSNARSHTILHFLGHVLCFWLLSRLCGGHCVWKPGEGYLSPIPWTRLLTDRDLWRDWRLSRDASLPCLQIA